jgi:hypothetical protein
MALLIETKQEQKVELSATNGKIRKVAYRIYNALKKQGDNVDKMGIDVNKISLMLANEVSANGIKEGIRNTCKFHGLNDEASQNSIIGLGISIIILSFIIPMAFMNFYNADTTTWCKTSSTGVKTADTMTQNLWYLIPAFVTIAVVVTFIKTRQG